jgi:hypothetical protein
VAGSITAQSPAADNSWRRGWQCSLYPLEADIQLRRNIGCCGRNRTFSVVTLGAKGAAPARYLGQKDVENDHLVTVYFALGPA